MQPLNTKPCTLSRISKTIGDGGEYFAKPIAGVERSPHSLRFPLLFSLSMIFLTVQLDVGPFPLGDYVVVDVEGIRDPPASTMMHEIGHSCNIIRHYLTTIKDLMYPDSEDSKGNIRGDRITWGKGI